jgi:hypothetical protein
MPAPRMMDKRLVRSKVYTTSLEKTLDFFFFGGFVCVGTALHN